jgi:hypothetical protein
MEGAGDVTCVRPRLTRLGPAYAEECVCGGVSPLPSSAPQPGGSTQQPMCKSAPGAKQESSNEVAVLGVPCHDLREKRPE